MVDGFTENVRQLAGEKGELYRRLTEKHGPGPHERRTGSIELRGGDSSLIVVVGLDDYVFAPSAGRYLWGNTITFQFCRRDCCDKSAAALSRGIAEDCCREMNVLYAHGHLLEEWDAKNMSRDGGIMAIGADVSRYLPGLYWLNYFGEPYMFTTPRVVRTGANRVAAFRFAVIGGETWMSESQSSESVWRSWTGDTGRSLTRTIFDGQR